MGLVILVTKTKQFGVYLAKMREKSGYKSQRSLALDAGISPATLSRIESGIQKPTPETLKALSRYLRDVTYEELLEKAGILEDNSSPSDKKDKTDELTSIMFHKWDKLDEKRRKQALKLIEILEQEADEENN
ncbi:helix-turn-helix domain-containing protein [Brevibacillus aydinogluensis]|uniref:helix-turn-helix domain-containing protein n=1 Tax=Brevibacillus aydinogluensis TaxID=927786 RepID=UPI0026F3ABF8|nr:helix-turn-helix domain-containing protein [Brevibacillus aydinogluensis]